MCRTRVHPYLNKLSLNPNTRAPRSSPELINCPYDDAISLGRIRYWSLTAPNMMEERYKRQTQVGVEESAALLAIPDHAK